MEYCQDGDIPQIYLHIFSKFIHKLNTFPIKMPADFFPEMEKLILKFTWDSE